MTLNEVKLSRYGNLFHQQINILAKGSYSWNTVYIIYPLHITDNFNAQYCVKIIHKNEPTVTFILNTANLYQPVFKNVHNIAKTGRLDR